jgi:hypothetical protein
MLRRLLCPHPDCPSTFKSRRGCTYHIRAVHLRGTNDHPPNADLGPEYDHALDQSEDEDARSENNRLVQDDPPADDLDATETLLQHPGLAGMCIVVMMNILFF